MSTSDDDEVKVDYEFHNNAAFVQIELGLEEVDVEEVQGLSEIRPMLQASNSPNMWRWYGCDKAFYKAQARGNQLKTFHQQDQRDLWPSS